MKIVKITTLVLTALFFNSCASGYQSVNPTELLYNSINSTEEVSLEYKYDLLDKKYRKKEDRKDVKLVAVKITNMGEKDLVFGEDIKLTYENGSQLLLLEQDKVFQNLKQHPASYLFYLPLTLLNLEIYNTKNGIESAQSIPIGLILGPGLAGGNLYKAAKSNKKFRQDLMEYNMHGRRISAGETVYGLVGVRADNYDALKINIPDSRIKTESIAPSSSQ